jgi:hypothetical protein
MYAHPAGADPTGGPIRDDLENHWLLVGCAMNGSGAQQPDIIRLAEEFLRGNKDQRP